MDFSNFDKKVDLEGLKNDVKEAEKNQPEGDYPEVPAGKYEVKFKNIEVIMTKKDPQRPMLAVEAVILKGEHKKQHIFMNRVIYGTKNDANMISSAVGWLKKLGTDLNIEFGGYSKFAELVMDVMEAVDNKFEYVVEFDKDAFNTISIKEVFEVE